MATPLKQLNAFDHTDATTTPRSRGGWVGRGSPTAAPARLRPVERAVEVGVCPVCTCDAVRFDEVELGRTLKLAECPRCEHRWTTPVATTQLEPARRRLAVVPKAAVDRAAQA